MNDLTITFTREEARIIEAALRRHRRSLRGGRAERRIRRLHQGYCSGVLHYERKDTESAIEKVSQW